MKKDIDFLSYDAETGKYDFSWNSQKRVADGRKRMVSLILKTLLTLKGSNLFDPQFGENFYNLYGVIDLSRAEEIKESFPVFIKNVESDIKKEQIKDRGLKDSESLKSIDVVSIDFEEKTGTWLITIQIVTKDLAGTNIVIV
jgi:hypothetical protein